MKSWQVYIILVAVLWLASCMLALRHVIPNTSQEHAGIDYVIISLTPLFKRYGSDQLPLVHVALSILIYDLLLFSPLLLWSKIKALAIFLQVALLAGHSLVAGFLMFFLRFTDN